MCSYSILTWQYITCCSNHSFCFDHPKEKQIRYIKVALKNTKGKNILLVGGTSGIGLQTAKLLQESGAGVLIASRKSSGASVSIGLPHLPLDVLAFESSFAVQLPSQLHGLVYCQLKPFEKLSIADFLKDFELNVLGAVQVLQAVMPNLKQAGGASVVLFSTVAAALGMP